MNTVSNFVEIVEIICSPRSEMIELNQIENIFRLQYVDEWKTKALSMSTANKILVLSDPTNLPLEEKFSYGYCIDIIIAWNCFHSGQAKQES